MTADQDEGDSMPAHPLYLAPTSLPDTPPLEFIDAAARAGFDGVGLRLVRSPGLPFHPVVGDAALVASVAAALRDTGLAVLDILSCYLRPDTDFSIFEPALALGAALGGRYVLAMGDDADAPRLRRNFAHFCALAAAHSLVPAVEPAVTRPIATFRQTLSLIEDVAPAKAVACLDPLNFVRAGGTLDEIARCDPTLLPFAQLTDGFVPPGPPDPARLGTPLIEPNRRALPGEGNVPMREILALLPPGIPLSVEIPPPAGDGPDAREWARVLADRCRAFLGS